MTGEMNQQEVTGKNGETGTAPDFLFIDPLMLAYRLGQVRDEHKAAMIVAARIATDAISYMKALENRGIGVRTKLHHFVGEVLAAPDFYRMEYPRILGLRREGEQAEPFLRSSLPLFLSEAVLTAAQRKVFYDAYWWFVHNHQPVFSDLKKGQCIGAWATDPKDNAAVIPRFENYMQRLAAHKTQRVRALFEGFPVDIVLAILRRAFL